MNLRSRMFVVVAAVCLGCLGAYDVYNFKATVKTP